MTEKKIVVTDMTTPRELEAALFRLCHRANKTERYFKLSEQKYKDKKAVADRVFAEVVKATDGKSMTEKKNLALLNPSWIEFEDELHKLEKEKNLAQIDYKAAERDWDTCRSILSSRNSERRTST